jgi:1,3-beta-galactosyl-N-acetylhexosamine phosphorylase
MAGLPYSLENSRLLHRALFWAAGKEAELCKWFSSNLNTDCAAYPETGALAVVNNTDINQETTIYDDKGEAFKVTLKPYEMKWFSLD